MPIKNLLDIHIPEWRNMNRGELLTALEDCCKMISLLKIKCLSLCENYYLKSGVSNKMILYDDSIIVRNLTWCRNGYDQLNNNRFILKYLTCEIFRRPNMPITDIINIV